MSLKSLIQQLDADGHRAEAALSLRRALALTPYDGELHDWHGVFAQDRARELSQFADANDPAVLRTLDSALASFQLALRLAPRRSDAYFHAGAALGGATVGRRAEAAATKICDVRLSLLGDARARDLDQAAAPKCNVDTYA